MERTREFDEDQQKLRKDAMEYQAEEGVLMSPSLETIDKGTQEEGRCYIEF